MNEIDRRRKETKKIVQTKCKSQIVYIRLSLILAGYLVFLVGENENCPNTDIFNAFDSYAKDNICIDLKKMKTCTSVVNAVYSFSMFPFIFL